MSCDGVLLVDKPRGPTSNDVVLWAKWVLGTKRVGHCGTLDPEATGLLVVCVGEATKLVEELCMTSKIYDAVFELGIATDTDDAAGRVLSRIYVPEALAASAMRVLESLQGTWQLPPPMYSALRIGGRRAHQFARSGAWMTLPPRTMRVRGIEPQRWQWHPRGTLTLSARVHVDKGTYVRALAREFGRRLGLPAHLHALRRIACGALELADPPRSLRLRTCVRGGIDGASERQGQLEGPNAHRVRLRCSEEGSRAAEKAIALATLMPVWQALQRPLIDLSPVQETAALRRLEHGQALAVPWKIAGEYAVRAPAQGILVLVQADPHPEGARLRPERVLRI